MKTEEKKEPKVLNWIVMTGGKKHKVKATVAMPVSSNDNTLKVKFFLGEQNVGEFVCSMYHLDEEANEAEEIKLQITIEEEIGHLVEVINSANGIMRVDAEAFSQLIKMEVKAEGWSPITTKVLNAIAANHAKSYQADKATIEEFDGHIGHMTKKIHDLASSYVSSNECKRFCNKINTILEGLNTQRQTLTDHLCSVKPNLDNNVGIGDEEIDQIILKEISVIRDLVDEFVSVERKDEFTDKFTESLNYIITKCRRFVRETKVKKDQVDAFDRGPFEGIDCKFQEFLSSYMLGRSPIHIDFGESTKHDIDLYINCMKNEISELVGSSLITEDPEVLAGKITQNLSFVGDKYKELIDELLKKSDTVDDASEKGPVREMKMFMVVLDDDRLMMLPATHFQRDYHITGKAEFFANKKSRGVYKFKYIIPQFDPRYPRTIWGARFMDSDETDRVLNQYCPERLDPKYISAKLLEKDFEGDELNSCSFRYCLSREPSLNPIVGSESFIIDLSDYKCSPGEAWDKAVRGFSGNIPPRWVTGVMFDATDDSFSIKRDIFCTIGRTLRDGIKGVLCSELVEESVSSRRSNRDGAMGVVGVIIPDVDIPTDIDALLEAQACDDKFEGLITAIRKDIIASSGSAYARDVNEVRMSICKSIANSRIFIGSPGPCGISTVAAAGMESLLVESIGADITKLTNMVSDRPGLEDAFSIFMRWLLNGKSRSDIRFLDKIFNSELLKDVTIDDEFSDLIHKMKREMNITFGSCDNSTAAGVILKDIRGNIIDAFDNLRRNSLRSDIDAFDNLQCNSPRSDGLRASFISLIKADVTKFVHEMSRRPDFKNAGILHREWLETGVRCNELKFFDELFN